MPLGFGHHADRDDEMVMDRRSESAGSSSLSSPQSSPAAANNNNNHTSASKQYKNGNHSNDTIQVLQRNPFATGSPASAYSSATGVFPSSYADPNALRVNDMHGADAPPKQRRPRKSREPKDAASGKTAGVTATASETIKEKKPRKSREPKVKSENPTTAAIPNPRKKPRTLANVDDRPARATPDIAAAKPAVSTPPATSHGIRQSTITEMVNNYQPSSSSHAGATNSAHASPRTSSHQSTLSHPLFQRQPPPPQSTTSATEALPTRHSLAPPVTASPPPRPISSGQRHHHS
ncbi:uncharacterized protein K489DRAFT_368108 [Dissoconium aciculare CBS 342.82]|uniref:Uncharacterized protein n=1 Tax=Dissoconium aciculare CBS 342.82 TaxID=1314786 RepID=A0A6J3MAI9_9PEZI|nr:uncharacterized protein K489DRAFT_368108 [Dissoconium aciculare CBS 342.82]KAF1824878.1 hypothetical protein K489DRAFT_368108 [Dissoconium aciculare CBS 342.82]